MPSSVSTARPWLSLPKRSKACSMKPCGAKSGWLTGFGQPNNWRLRPPLRLGSHPSGSIWKRKGWPRTVGHPCSRTSRHLPPATCWSPWTTSDGNACPVPWRVPMNCALNSACTTGTGGCLAACCPSWRRQGFWNRPARTDGGSLKERRHGLPPRLCAIRTGSPGPWDGSTLTPKTNWGSSDGAAPLWRRSWATGRNPWNFCSAKNGHGPPNSTGWPPHRGRQTGCWRMPSRNLWPVPEPIPGCASSKLAPAPGRQLRPCSPICRQTALSMSSPTCPPASSPPPRGALPI